MLGLRQFFTHQTCGGKIWNLLKIRDWEWESSALLAGGCRSIDSSTLLVVLHTSDMGRGCEFSEKSDWGPIELYTGVCSSVGSTTWDFCEYVFYTQSYVFSFSQVKKKLFIRSKCRLNFCHLHRFLHHFVKFQLNPSSGLAVASEDLDRVWVGPLAPARASPLPRGEQRGDNR